MVRVITSEHQEIPPGALLLSINDCTIDDFLELKFYNDITIERKILLKNNGCNQEVLIKPNEEMSITVEEPSYRRCNNNCRFCFVNGLPEGLRKELYFRDDDYRLSFLFGNFLSLTNVTRNDIDRIARLRLSPLYVSVHTTDPKARENLFENPNAANIMMQLEDLVQRNITIHTQVVVIPGVTDGRNLLSTINNLEKFYPGIASIGVVPVGISKYLREIEPVSPSCAREVIAIAEELHTRFRKKYNYGFVYVSDEMYARSQQPIPDTEYYDDLPQIENGIGMARTFLDDIARLSNTTKLCGSYLFLTGHLAYPYLTFAKEALEYSNPVTIDILPIVNTFFGSTVTASGLLTARDIKQTLDTVVKKYDRIFIPSNCVNDEGQFIDKETLCQEQVHIAPDSVGGLLQCLQS